jgi:putative ABC transport system permease protein
VSRLAWSQLRFRPARALGLLLGILLAVTAFAVLTAASQTSQLRTVGTISAHFRTAYDILVRPKGTRTGLETTTGTVQPNFLSGIYGGISLGQYQRIQQIPGVDVAAPIAMVGYSLPVESVPVRLPAADVAGSGRELYRYTTTWVSAGGTTQIRQPASYVYITPHRLGLDNGTGATAEMLPGGSVRIICPQPGPAADPFGPALQSQLWCWSRINALGGGGFENLDARHPGFAVTWRFPMLIAAIDPAAEARLDGLDRAVTSGRYLGENASPGTVSVPGGMTFTTFPVLAAASSGIGEYAVTQVQRLPDPATPPVFTPAHLPPPAATAPGRTIMTIRIGAQQAYLRLLARLSGQPGSYPGLTEYWSAGTTRYRRNPDGSLTPVVVHNPLTVWRSAVENGGSVAAPLDNADRQYRMLTDHGPTSNSFTGGTFPVPVPRLAGVFDPGRVRAFDPLSRVPLGAFEPVMATPADGSSAAVLGGALLPSLNLGGYVSQPPQLITTLAALPALENSQYFRGDLHAGDPISVIRVRVAGVTGPDPVSRERIREVAQQISLRTGLVVDIVAGSSPAPTRIVLPAGSFGQPALLLSEGWVKKGVALAILTAVDRKSVVLFALILVVCAFFVANSAMAAVRGRRQELGVLACLGWTRARIFWAVLGELAVIGLSAGIAGALLSLPLAAVLHLNASPGRALLAVPAAVGLAVAAGAFPAWLASRADPAASLRPPVLATRRGHHPAGVTGLAVVNVLRTPGRTLLGAVSLAAGIAALTMLAGVTVAFRGVVVGSLLGDAVAVQVRGVDYLAVAATVALGVLAVADVVFLNIRERAGELAVIRACGWRESALGRLVVTEGALVGAVGAVAGATAGLAGAAWFAQELPFRLILAAAAAAAAGVLVTIGCALVPARLLRRLPTAQLLAEE